MYGKPVELMHNTVDPLHYTYDVESVLGSGGLGIVYKAWHKRLEKHVVLKELKGSGQKTIQAQRNEVEALKNVKHMHIPQVFDYLTDGSSTYTAMEYIEGVSFDKLLSQGISFSPSQVVKWYYQLATALDALHAKGICHRDIKPANIIKTPNDDVSLIDFGSALVYGNNTGIINSSMGYASPEQIAYFQICQEAHRLSKSTQTPKEDIYKELLKTSSLSGAINWKLSDIYSLGAVMFQLLTGMRPSSAITVTRYMPMTHGYITQLAAIMERSMHADPSQRYSSARELCRTLSSINTIYHYSSNRYGDDIYEKQHF